MKKGSATVVKDLQSLGAKNGTRTRDPDLGKVVLYQLSYFRIYSKSVSIRRYFVGADGFEPPKS